MIRFSIATILLAIALVARIPAQAEPLSAQVTSTCDQLITRAIDTAAIACTALDRNQACYGNNLVNAQLRQGATDAFVTTGDIASVVSLQKVVTAPLDEQLQLWGIALLKVQANIPGTLPGQNVTFLLFGDATVDNPTPDMRAVTISTGIGQLGCADAPPSALLMQAPEGQRVTMNINGAEMTLGSTAYLTAVVNDRMTVATIEGDVTLNAFGVVQTILPGDEAHIPLGNVIGNVTGLSVIGPPSPPQPMDFTGLSKIPLRLLPRPVLLPGSGIVPVAATTVGGCAPRPDWTNTYTIQSGDTLSGIAARAGVSLDDLVLANCMTIQSLIRPGDVLRVPGIVSTRAPRPTAVPPTAVPPTSPPPTPTTPPEPTGAPTGPNFRVDNESINLGECTTVRWDADNIKEIYFEGHGTAGHSQQQVCPKETSSYSLMVIWPDNSEHHYGVRVSVIPPGPVCGNSVCEDGETYGTCSYDCPG